MIKGIGTDIVKISRINPKIARNVLTAEEMGLYEQASNKKQYLASRFCLKEAIIKATNKQFSLKEIVIKNNDDGSLWCNIEGMHLSLSHEQDYCVSMCIWESK